MSIVCGVTIGGLGEFFPLNQVLWNEMKVWQKLVKKVEWSNEKKGPLGCLGDLLGMKYYPVEGREYFIHHEMDFLINKKIS